MKKWPLLSIMLLVTPGCKKQATSFSGTLDKKEDGMVYDLDFVRQQEARLIDIPIPFNAKPIPQNFWLDTAESAGVILAYHVTMSPQDIISFYSQEMERSGWDQVAQFNAHEYLLSFEKPGRVCSISLRQVNAPTFLLTIFTSNKRSSV